jgi:hypothetical protein
VRFTLTAGQKGDAPQAAELIEGLSVEVVMADTAYDADHLRQAIAAKGALAQTQQPVTCAQISARQASLCSAPSRGMLLLKTQAVPPRRNPLRNDRPKLPRSHHSCRYHLMDATSVNTT